MQINSCKCEEANFHFFLFFFKKELREKLIQIGSYSERKKQVGQ